jgi:hypothetical protein
MSRCSFSSGTSRNSTNSRTVAALKGHQAVVLPMIGLHGSRIIDTAGGSETAPAQ